MALEWRYRRSLYSDFRSWRPCCYNHMSFYLSWIKLTDLTKIIEKRLNPSMQRFVTYDGKNWFIELLKFINTFKFNWSYVLNSKRFPESFPWSYACCKNSLTLTNFQFVSNTLFIFWVLRSIFTMKILNNVYADIAFNKYRPIVKLKKLWASTGKHILRLAKIQTRFLLWKLFFA